MRTTRTDIHRPSAIVPGDYEYVGIELMKLDADLGACQALIDERFRIRAHMDRTGGTYATHEHGGNCMVCGAWAVYTVLFYHRPSNTYIRTGQDCARKLELSFDEGDANLFRTRVREALAAKAGKRKALALLQQHGIEEAWDVQYDPPQDGREARWQSGVEERTIRDIVERLIRYGSISDKQISYVRSLLDRIHNRLARAQQQAIEENHARDTAAPWTPGRQDVSGTVVSAKWIDRDYAFAAHIAPSQLKMLLKIDDGRKLWVTVPRAMVPDTAYSSPDRVNELRDARVDGLRVTVKLSDKDPIFAFGSRPTGGTITLKQEAA